MYSEQKFTNVTPIYKSGNVHLRVYSQNSFSRNDTVSENESETFSNSFYLTIFIKVKEKRNRKEQRISQSSAA